MSRFAGIDATKSTAAPAKKGETPNFTATPKGWEPGIDEYDEGRPTVITAPAVPVGTPRESQEDMKSILSTFDVELPAGAVLKPQNSKYIPNLWFRDNPGEDAYTQPGWIHKFDITYPAVEHKPDYEGLIKYFRTRKPRKPVTAAPGAVGYVVAISDPQIGKAHQGADADQGTEQVAERIMSALDTIVAEAKELKPSEIFLVDVGDPIENFCNVESQKQTNDLTLTEQIDAWEQLFANYVKALAPLSPKLTVGAVPSNHGQNRNGGKQSVAGPDDDFGMLALKHIEKSVRWAGLENVVFARPRKGLEMFVTNIAGTNIGVVHGHQVSNPNGIATWWEKVGHNRGTDMHHADLLLTGHFHHLRAESIKSDRVWFQCPTVESGSTWVLNLKGASSTPGIMTFKTLNGKHTFPDIKAGK